MNGARTWLVGGLSTLHDPLLAAALRSAGLPAAALHPRTDAGLRRARALGNHGQCNPAHYAVGAVLEHARQSGEDPAAFAGRHGWITAGSCGPCRLAGFGFEYARVLDGGGLGRLPVARVEPLALAVDPAGAVLPGLDSQAGDLMLDAVVAGDVLTRLGHALRPYAIDPREVDAVLATGAGEVAGVLEAGKPVHDVLRQVGARAMAIALDPARILPRVLLVGEPWTTLADGDPSYDLARRLGVHGVEVDAPVASDWLHYRLWEEERDAGASPDGQERTSRVQGLRRIERRLRALWRRLASAAGLGPAPRPDMSELAALAAPHYDPDVRGGSAHLEVGRALQAERDRTAHLVLSLKPFGCLPSSHVSDGILSVLLRRQPRMRFLALETCGDADVTAESRVEMAVHAAALEAAEELEAACERRRMSPSLARQALAARPSTDLTPDGPRTYACSAAEWLSRGASSA